MLSRNRLRRLKDKVEDLLRDSPPDRTTASLPDTRQSSPTPLPQTVPRSVTAVPSTAATSTQIDPGSQLLSPSTAPIPSQATLTLTANVPPSLAPDLRSSMPDPTASLVSEQIVSSNEGTSMERTKSIAWSGLKTLLKLVDASSDVFPPLKSAVGGLNQCIDIFERASKGRKDYTELQLKLDSLLQDLSQYLDGPAGLTMTMSMKNLAIGIDEELISVLQKAQRGTGRRLAEAPEDGDEIMECYRRIQGHLERLTLNANLSIWKFLNEQATVCASMVSTLKSHLLRLRVKEARLLRLSPTMAAEYNSAEAEDVKRGPCTPGTRKQELAKLRGWLSDRTAGAVYWMNGMAGTGKTTIAYSLCDQLETTAQLGASFFCSRLIPECRNVKLILPAIAYQLARFSRPFRHALSRVLEADPDVHTRVLRTQFESLLVKPLMEVKKALPADFLVVIDALDECENANSVGQVLDILLSQTLSSDLPIRFLLSSRPEPEIFPRMMSRVGQARLVLHDLDVETVEQDIETYLRAELKDIPLNDSQITALIKQSGVLFIFAATAARYLKDGLHLMDHDERLATILNSSPADGDSHNVDPLYSAILGAVFQNAKFTPSNRNLIKSILDTVVCAQESMTLSALAGLMRLKNTKQVDGLLRPLSSVVNISEATGLVTTLHASFPDFMLDQGRSSTFHCNSATNHVRLAKACFELIKSNVPQFNICGFQSSYVRDDQLVTDLGKMVDRAVSLELFYACRHWSAHLERSEWHSDLGDHLFDFLSKRLLLWMEVLNVKKNIHLGPRIILQAEAWSRANNRSIKTTELAHDAWCFAMRFTSAAISQSTPHLYISMLLFWPESSPIAEHYAKKMRGAIKAQGTAISRRQLALLATWSFAKTVQSARFSSDGSLIVFGVSSTVFVIDATTGRTVVGPLEHESTIGSAMWESILLCEGKPTVASVAFSPDGSLITSGSADTTIRAWSAQNGQSIGDPITGHTAGVNSVCFSPDGKRIASGSTDMTVRIWDVQSGQMVVGPLQSHSGAVYSVCFSLDGTHLASGSEYGTIQVWDAQDGRVIAGPLEGHTNSIRSISFSQDGTRIASGSSDYTIRVWDIQSGDTVVGPLRGHSGSVHSISFSSDDSCIVSGSGDNTIMLWDLNSNPISVRTLKGHTSEVTSVSFSFDSSRIVSSSFDRSIRVWDARNQTTVDDPLDGHTGAVISVGFSPNGKHIVSGSRDKTIRMWDAQSGQLVGSPLQGHTDVVRSICFSPDGACLFSGSDDMTIRCWDVQSGQEVVDPLEGHTSSVLSICLSPDGALIVSGSRDGTIRIWNAQDGKPVGNPLEGHHDSVNSVCFSPDGMRIASGSDDLTVRVWDVRREQTIAGPFEGHTGDVLSVCFSPDGTRLASASWDKTIRLWDAQSGEVVFALEGHTKGVNSVCFSPDGSTIVSGSYDTTLQLWDARRGQTIGDPLVGHTALVSSVAFSSDGRHIVSGSKDETIQVWDVSGRFRMAGDTDLPTSHTTTPGPPLHPHESWDLQEDGWLVDSQSRLLAWIPLDLRLPFPCPHSLVISTQGSFKLDIDSANLGELWAEFYQPPTC